MRKLMRICLKKYLEKNGLFFHRMTRAIILKCLGHFSFESEKNFSLFALQPKAKSENTMLPSFSKLVSLRLKNATLRIF